MKLNEIQKETKSTLNLHHNFTSFNNSSSAQKLFGNIDKSEVPICVVQFDASILEYCGKQQNHIVLKPMVKQQCGKLLFFW